MHVILKCKNNYILWFCHPEFTIVCLSYSALADCWDAILTSCPSTAIAHHAVAIRGVFWVKEKARVLFASIS